MFTDLVGFTAAAQSDESKALARLRETERMLRPLFAPYGGREIKSTGDGFLVEFKSALKATECAIEIQRRLQTRNARSGADPIELRIGIHVGDVEDLGGDIFGDAVNVASRIVGVADAGGVCVSGQVFDHVHKQIAHGLEKVTPTSLKGVTDPIEVYRVVSPLTRPGRPAPDTTSPRVAVLPLANISPDPKDEYFADGLTEELISTLSKVSGLSVLSRTSIMQYKDRSKSIGEIGRALDARTIIEGSVRTAGSRVRVAIQMIDAPRDKHVWSESYDRDLADIFAIQGDIALRVAAALKVRLLATETEDIERKPTESVEAYQLYLRGRYHYNRSGREDVARALELFRQAIERDPRCAVAFAGVSDCYHMGSHSNWFSPEEAYPPMKDFATNALKIDPRLAESHAALGAVYFHYDWKWREAEREFLRAIELKPSYAGAYDMYSYLLAILGRQAESYERAKRGAELSPQVLWIWLHARLGPMGTVLFPGKMEEAISLMQGVVKSHPDFLLALDCLAFAYYRASNSDKALAELRAAVSRSNGRPIFKADLAFLLALVGRKEEARTLLDELTEDSKHVYVSPVQRACIQFHLGNSDEAFASLETAFERRAIDLVDIRLVPEMSELRADTRWKSLENRMGLPVP